MAYEFDLEAEVPAEPFVDAMGTEICEFALGFDIERDVAIVMSVMLVPGGSYLDEEIDHVFDLRFGIRERDLTHEWKVTPPDYSTDGANRYIPKGERAIVMDRLLDAVQVLVEHSAAILLTMENFHDNLPAEALTKYEIICGRLTDCGFELKDTFRDETSGKNYWFLSRAD
jgi:hypothetical protein